MLRTKYLPLSVFLLLALINPSWSQADPLTNPSRDLIIQKQMDCVSRGLKNAGIGWQDVCDIPEASTQSPADKTEAVNRQLDEIASKEEFPGVEQDAGKVFTNSDQPDRQSVKGMLSQIANPDVEGTIIKKTSSNIKTRVHTIDLGGEVFYYRFVMPHVLLEDSSDGTSQTVRDKNIGPMEGVYANYVYRPLRGNLLNNPVSNVYFLQARYADGQGLAFSGEGNVKNRDDAAEFRGLIGKDYAMGADTMVTPYLGFGYRYLFEHGNGLLSSLGTPMVNRRSEYWYLPMGGNVAFNLPKDWEMDVNAEYDILLQGIQRNYYSDWNQYVGAPVYPDVSFRQSHGFGLRGSIKFIKKGPVLDFYVEPYFRFWNIDNSKWDNSLVEGENANTTAEIGSKFGVQF